MADIKNKDVKFENENFKKESNAQDGDSVKENIITFKYRNSLRAKDKMKLVKIITDFIVAEDYNLVIKDMMFDFVAVMFFTDIDMSDIVNTNNTGEFIDKVEKFLAEYDVIGDLKKRLGTEIFDELKNAVDMNIEYRLGAHGNHAV